MLDNYVHQYPKLFEYVSKLAGLPKSFGVHPCGKVLSQERADQYNAIEYNADTDEWVLQGDMHTADDLGLVKCDFLGLRTLDVIYDILGMVGKDYNYIAPHKIDTNDQAVWKEFAEGHTDCIFQFESDGMKKMLSDMKCNCIENLSAANALYRPGAKAFIPNYVNRKNGTEKIEYLHPDLKPILSTSYGIIVFQEQLIEIGRLAGLPNPDELRKATAKKKPELMKKIEPLLKNGLIDKGWTKEQCDKLWETILDFARYSFNKCVSGDTEIHWSRVLNQETCDKPDSIIKVEDLYYHTHHINGEFSVKNYGYSYSMKPNGKIVINRIINIQQSGIRPLYRVITTTGKFIDCTTNHKFPTPNGIKHLYDLSIGDALYIVDKLYEFRAGSKSVFEDTIMAVEFIGKEMTYDITMDNPYHNFVANNGIVTCNSHSAAYALTAYILMYLKVHHPSEFITACINSYEGDIDGIVKTVAEGKRMKIPFKYDTWRTVETKTMCKDGTVYLGLNTIKGFGDSQADVLHRISDKSATFLDVLKNIKEEKGGISDTQFSTLINHNFFAEFGDSCMLEQQHQTFNMVYGKKIFKKNADLPISEDILRMFAKETDKQFRDVDHNGLFNYLAEHTPYKPKSMGAILNAELKDFGYILYTNPKIRGLYYVLDVNTKYTPRVTLYTIQKGVTFTAKIPKKKYNTQPVCVGNLIEGEFNVKPKVTLDPTSNKDNPRFITVPNTVEYWVDKYRVVQ